jgi:hypothetical protein
LKYKSQDDFNLIKLTAMQHFTKPHPKNRTLQINKDNQLTCLLAKVDAVEKSLKAIGDKDCRKESFIFVINTGLDVHFSTTLSFLEVKNMLV